VRRTKAEGKNLGLELNKFLRCYRATPHATTGEAPSVLLYGRQSTSRLPGLETTGIHSTQYLEKVREVDFKAKSRMKNYADKRIKSKDRILQTGQLVYFKWKRTSKYQTIFDPSPYRVVAVNGSMITAENEQGHQVTRNIARFRQAPETIWGESRVTRGRDDDYEFWPEQAVTAPKAQSRSGGGGDLQTHSHWLQR